MRTPRVHQVVSMLRAALFALLLLAVPAAGATLREADLRPRQWFDAGERVQIVAVGGGISVAGEGQAMTPGFEGRSVRVRTDSGRIVSGKPTGPKRVEVPI